MHLHYWDRLVNTVQRNIRRLLRESHEAHEMFQQNAELLNIKVGGTYSYHRSFIEVCAVVS
jgi:hypothetical protein